MTRVFSAGQSAHAPVRTWRFTGRAISIDPSQVVLSCKLSKVALQPDLFLVGSWWSSVGTTTPAACTRKLTQKMLYTSNTHPGLCLFSLVAAGAAVFEATPHDMHITI
jgi:hypothetical protein